MKNFFELQISPLFGRLAVLSICVAGLTSYVRSACYSTPSAAANSGETGLLVSPISSDGGYRLASVRTDIVLGRRWAMIANCEHPEWPVFALQPGDQGLTESPIRIERIREGVSRAQPLVRAGDVVRLWKQEKFLRIEVAGVSEESGDLGKTIHVRLLHSGDQPQFAQEEFSGIVRGVSDVEIEP